MSTTKRQSLYRRPALRLLAMLAMLLTLISTRSAAADTSTITRRFDLSTFNCTPDYSSTHFCPSQFNELNQLTNHFLATGNDKYRVEARSAGNYLAAYYNTLNSGYGSISADTKVQQIIDYLKTNFLNVTYNGSATAPTWVLLNEISSSLWPSDPAYRTWVKRIAYLLKSAHSKEVILFSPFPNPANNAADWQYLGAYSYIAIEGYLSGKDINANGNSIAWCQGRYQSFKNSYLNLGVPASKIYLTEHFAQTTSDKTFGRAGVSYAGWENAIRARAAAAHNVGFAGFVSYGWAGNAMLVSEADMIHFENVYRTQVLP